MFGRGAPRCPRCNNSVYAAEEIIGAGQKWHNDCFTCKSCKVRLSSTTLTEKDNEIYCSLCYSKNWGPKGYGIGSQTLTFTGVSVADGAKSPASSVSANKSPNASPVSSSSAASGGGTCCGAKVTGNFCGTCGEKVSLSTPVASPPASSVSTAAKTWNQGSPSTSSSTTSSLGIVRPPQMKSGPVGGDRCAQCNDRVYDAEKVIAANKIFHILCFRCKTCRKGLDSGSLNDKDGAIYCNACYSKNFGPKGYGFSGGAATVFANTK